MEKIATFKRQCFTRFFGWFIFSLLVTSAIIAVGAIFYYRSANLIAEESAKVKVGAKEGEPGKVLVKIENDHIPLIAAIINSI